MAKRPAARKTSTTRAKPGAKAAARETAPVLTAAKAKKAVSKVAAKLDPTQPTATRAQSGKSTRRPAIEALIRVARGSLPVALAHRFIDADLLSQAAALALYALLSLAPLLLILVWLTSGILPDAQEALMQQIAALVGSEAEQVARTIVSNAAQRPDTGSIAGWWSLALLFVGATAVFAQLQDVLNRIFRTDATALPGLKAWLRKRVFSLGLVFALGFLLVVSMTLSTAMQLLFGRVEWMLPLVATAATWLVYALAFALMYHYLPDRRVGWRRALGGGAATALLFMLGRAAIAWYVGRVDPGSAYGSMGTLVLALVWIYYAALVVFIGALLTAVVDERAKARAGARKPKAG
ncbi:YihY/virulence factor BrkB family protein [Pseudoxanthomonas gei]|uniref:YihY/virulence factor BrkB family protein n=1 Tax=Pseudoxanthomonas gei TaxID=1383030 RepID=A0ABX0A8P8_9GAMM|nr:YihY/virulence factor BrkB family protein [Pseudoxanthomonas gei]NDK37887.1 YihY/virulence factor BrkB family protein [Pseudoxanthomonas gei]